MVGCMVAGRMVGCMVGFFLEGDDGCIDGGMIDSDFRSDCIGRLLLYIAVIPLALAIPSVPEEDGDRTMCSTPHRLMADVMAGMECNDAEEWGELCKFSARYSTETLSGCSMETTRFVDGMEMRLRRTWDFD